MQFFRFICHYYSLKGFSFLFFLQKWSFFCKSGQFYSQVVFMTMKKALSAPFRQSFPYFLKSATLSNAYLCILFTPVRLSFLPDFTERLFFALSAQSIDYTEGCKKYTFLCSFHDTSFPSPEVKFCRYLRAIQLLRYVLVPVYVHENPGPFPAIKKSLRKKRDVYFRIFGAACWRPGS